MSAIYFKGAPVPCLVDDAQPAGRLSYLLKSNVVATVPVGSRAPAEFDAVRINPAESWLMADEPN